MNRMIGSPLTTTNSTALTDISNTTRQYGEWYMIYQYGDILAVDTDDDRGIIVGSGSAAESYTDYTLSTKIIDGTAAGQLRYKDSSITYGGTPPDKTRMITRTFVNDSGGSIDVREVGLIFRTNNPYITNLYYLVARDILDSTITVTDESTLGVQYTISMIYPS